MNIVCTDEASDGTLERAMVEAAGLTFHHRPCRTPAEFIEASADADALLVGLLPVPGDMLHLRPQLKLIVACSTGFDHIDLAAADELGILVCNAGDYCSDEVADHTLTLLLAAWRSLLPLCAEARNGGWNFDAAGPLRPLKGATLG
jgi:D-3-phosphoglycerate dehydrogenase